MNAALAQIHARIGRRGIAAASLVLVALFASVATPQLLGHRVAVEPVADVLEPHPRQDRDPVVRPLTEHRALVTRTDELHRGEELKIWSGLTKASVFRDG